MSYGSLRTSFGRLSSTRAFFIPSLSVIDIFRSVSKGSARIMDPFGFLDDTYPFIQDDEQAIAKDWQIVGSAVGDAIDQYDREKQPN